MRKLKVASKAEKQIDKFTRKNLVAVIENSRENPYPTQSNVKKLKNSPDYSVRMGNYRIIYWYSDDVIEITSLGHHNYVYRELNR